MKVLLEEAGEMISKLGKVSISNSWGLMILTVLMASCSNSQPSSNHDDVPQEPTFTVPSSQVKPVIYQVFTRLFGNKTTTNKPWGTIADNGVGKFSDFTPYALNQIKRLGVSHVWYTGVPHHAVIADYQQYGISLDDPDVVKGRAGSPYAVKDYYSVNPDLAEDPDKRLQEFEALIERSHKAGLKVIIDIVPNHVARNYESLAAPAGVEDFGAGDDTRYEYLRDNNFYYVVGEAFKVPEGRGDYQPLGGTPHPLADGLFKEFPAKWTGNGARSAQPEVNDWYETVKINFGVRPDGSYDFVRLPAAYFSKDVAAHAAFWQQREVPDSWKKFRHIVHYWLDKGVDGFRYDMAEMVPVEFWSYLNSSIKLSHPDTLLLAEVYNPALYRDYLRLGKMDYLYDKVEFYDTVKRIMQQKQGTGELALIQSRMQDIESHMLHFLENHDEQRIASPEFAGEAEVGKPALVVSALISRAPLLIYFGQEVGEDGSEETGFGDPSRTSIFDYVGVPAHQRWMNNGAFDGGQLTEKEAKLRDFYQQVLQIAAFHPAMAGDYVLLHQHNMESGVQYSASLFSFMRWNETNGLIVVSNFSDKAQADFELMIPASHMQKLHISGKTARVTDLLSTKSYTLSRHNSGGGKISLLLPPLGSVVLEFAQ